jgi:hypothetical protein
MFVKYSKGMDTYWGVVEDNTFTAHYSTTGEVESTVIDTTPKHKGECGVIEISRAEYENTIIDRFGKGTIKLRELTKVMFLDELKQKTVTLPMLLEQFDRDTKWFNAQFTGTSIMQKLRSKNTASDVLLYMLNEV